MHRNPEHCRTLLPAECTEGLDERLAEVTRDMRTALERGFAVTVVTHEATLTTQEAADVLGVSRPTLVRLLEQGHIPYDQPGRHRRLRLKDVLEFRDAHHHESGRSDIHTVDGAAGPGPIEA
jgi:excisionase family DNA binding protein